MKVEAKFGADGEKVYINIVLTTDELASLFEGKVVEDDDTLLPVKIVAYGEEETELDKQQSEVVEITHGGK